MKTFLKKAEEVLECKSIFAHEMAEELVKRYPNKYRFTVRTVDVQVLEERVA